MSGNKIDYKKLDEEKREEIHQSLVRKVLWSREDLDNYLKFYLDVDLADCVVSRFANSTPLDMVWDIYKFCRDSTEEDEPMATFYIAGRASQKTLSAAVLQVLLPLHFKRGVVHFGGTKDQANRAYSYFKKFVNKKYIAPYLKAPPTMTQTIFNIVNENEGNEVDVEILPISTMAVQGPHQPVVSLDELASLSPEKQAAYNDVSGIPVYTDDGKPWVQFGISSRKGKYTIIENEFENREKTGVEFKFWTVLENTKRCPDKISGTKDIYMYVNAEKNVAYSESDYHQLPEKEKSTLEKVTAKDKCISCPMASNCSGDLKKQKSTCRTLRPTMSTIKEFKRSDLDWFLSQKMSMKPSAEGLVFPRFEREKFEKTPTEIYKIFMGRDPGIELTEDDIIREMVNAGCKRVMGLDHGYTHPTALCVVYMDGRENAYIMKTIEETELEPEEVRDLVQEVVQKYKVQKIFPDFSSPAINKMLKKVCSVYDPKKKTGTSAGSQNTPGKIKNVINGIILIKQKMSPTVGNTKLFGLKGNCETLIDNFEKYHYATDSGDRPTDNPEKEFDDSIDALSYVAQNNWSTSKSLVTGNASEDVGEQLTESEKVQKQYDNWLSEHVNEVVSEKGGSDGVKSNKSKSFFWDI